MRVGLAIETDLPGGAETVVLELARELQGRGIEVVALGPVGREGWLTNRLAEMGIERDLVDFGGFYSLSTIPQIVSMIRTRRLDVLHSHEFAMAVAGAPAACLAGCRHVITMHGEGHYTLRVRRRMALRVAVALSSRTVAVSEALRQSLASSIPLPAEAIEVVRNGVAEAGGTGVRVREELGIGASDVLVLAVGGLRPVKGHAVLLEAVSKLPPLAERLVVAIAGGGAEESNLRALATDLGIAKDVRLLGYRSDISDLLHGADVFAMPSLSEGLPMAIIEAMLAGKAIVASDVGGMREVLPNSKVGMLVRSRDPEMLAVRLAELIRDPSLRRRMGNAARARALEHFTASAMAEKYISMYTK